MIRHIPLFALTCCSILAQPSQAAMVTWVDWISADTISAQGNMGGINVNFSGDLNPIAQTSGGTNFWASNSSTYTSFPEVDNPPPNSDIIRMMGGANTGTQTLTFASPVTDPVMAILSLGSPSRTMNYEFNADFSILNNGPGHWGNGLLSELPGNILQGTEGHGIIQFEGTFSSISWTMPTFENWHGFTIGVAEPNPVPEFSSILALFSVSFLGLRLRRKKQGNKRSNRL